MNSCSVLIVSIIWHYQFAHSAVKSQEKSEEDKMLQTI